MSKQNTILFLSTLQNSGRVELVAGSGVYCSAMKLQVAVRGAKTASMLARYLMEVFWDQATLAQSSLSAKGVYQQLDPNITEAITCKLVFQRPWAIEIGT